MIEKAYNKLCQKRCEVIKGVGGKRESYSKSEKTYCLCIYLFILNHV